MTEKELFENRESVAEKLKNLLRERGYTKISFASWAGIYKPTLERLLSGTIENRMTFNRTIHRVLEVLKITPDELIFFEPGNKPVDAMFFDSFPAYYQMTGNAEKEYDCLMDIIDLCEIYY